ncbi:pyridoxal phosphate-dependent aminotransferase [Clostridium oryzae]|uniref:Putative N-acetyl-LL-diaminopimelate aminotransferase n=1 Tax=Clostridium oryzae TaxID=1450648 RepID=A0A1V4IGC1_9CLOT|nr:aminotransferase class I/II-fold pyridoxal phosphate-dependent enzyme [Clostridium oryzae]OPJ59041.1 putative N-acetyl-LL-diaminopimelate aminotransferase [Clostridium oryzae]
MNRNLEKIAISGIRRIHEKAIKVPEAINMTIGEPDFNVPIEIKEAMIRSIEENKTRYTSNIGLEELRKEISLFLKNKNIYFDTDEICITVGGSEGIFAALETLLEKGDSVIVPTPNYPAYSNTIKILGGEVLTTPLKEDLSLDIKAIEDTIKSKKPKLLVVSYPNNPTGKVLDKNTWQKLCEVVEQNDIMVISDEMYSSICFEEYYSIAQKKDILDKIILIGGFSKMFSMTGLRTGFVCAKRNIIKEFVKVHQNAVSCAPSIAQWGALEGLKKCKYHIAYINEELLKRRDYICERLIGLGFNVIKPSGAFYIFPDIKKFKMSSEDFCDKMLYEAKVAAVPGTAFGLGGEGYIRMSYCCSLSVIEEAMDRIEALIYKISNQK